MKHSNLTKRNERICNLYVGTDKKKGLTLDAAGEPFGLTRERVRQILNENGITDRHPYNWARDPEKRAAKVRGLYRSGIAIDVARAACGHAPERAYVPSADDRRASRIARFWKLVDKGKKNECWPWLGKYGSKYPLFKFEGTDWMHIALFLISRGHKPKGRVVRTCPRRDCANPVHIVDGRGYHHRQKSVSIPNSTK